MIEADLAPEDTSKNPVITAFAQSGAELMRGREQISPESEEKVITHAEIHIIFTAAERMASGMARDKGMPTSVGGGEFVTFFSLEKDRPATPTVTAERSTEK